MLSGAKCHRAIHANPEATRDPSSRYHTKCWSGCDYKCWYQLLISSGVEIGCEWVRRSMWGPLGVESHEISCIPVVSLTNTTYAWLKENEMDSHSNPI